MDITSPEPTDLGTQLRVAREGKGLSLDQLSRITRLRVPVLQALEHNDWSALPEPIYVQSFLRAYAQAVGLPAEPLLEGLQRGPVAAPAFMPAVAKPNKDSKPAASVPVSSLLVGLAVLVALGAYIYFGLQSNKGFQFPSIPSLNAQSSNTTSNDATVPSEGNTVSMSEVQPKPETSPVPEPETPTTSTPTTSTPSNPAEPRSVTLSVVSVPTGATVLVDRIRIGITPLELAPVSAGPNRELRVELTGRQAVVQTIDLSTPRAFSVNLAPAPSAVVLEPASKKAVVLTFKGSSWVRITDAAGRKLFEGAPPAGTVKSFDGVVNVRVGRPDLVLATINGKLRGALATRGSPISVRLP